MATKVWRIWIFWVGTCACLLGSPHKFHTSLTRIDVNRESRTLEITLQVFTEDLEQALRQKENAKLNIERHPQAEQKVMAYIADAFRLKRGDGTALSLQWVGMEIGVEVTHVYLEVMGFDPQAQIVLRQGLFFELHRDQVNTVNLHREKKVQSLVFTWGKDFKTFAREGRIE